MGTFSGGCADSTHIEPPSPLDGPRAEPWPTRIPPSRPVTGRRHLEEPEGAARGRPGRSPRRRQQAAVPRQPGQPAAVEGLPGRVLDRTPRCAGGGVVQALILEERVQHELDLPADPPDVFAMFTDP